jgi:hypothetical protein
MAYKRRPRAGPRADQVDVLPRIGRNIFDDVGGRVVSGGLLLCVHTR